MALTEILVIENLADIPPADGQPRIKPPEWSQADWIASFFFLHAPEGGQSTLWCRRCGTPVLYQLMTQHYFELHGGTRL